MRSYEEIRGAFDSNDGRLACEIWTADIVIEIDVAIPRWWL